MATLNDLLLPVRPSKQKNYGRLICVIKLISKLAVLNVVTLCLA